MVELSLCVFLISLFCFIGNTRAYREWSADDFPNPVKDIHLCGRRGVASWICDPDGVLSYEEANRLEGIIFALSKETHSGCSMDKEKPGFQLGLALMRKISIYAVESADEIVQLMAERLHSKWGVGHQGCDDGVLFLLSTEDRKMYISTGKTAMKLLTDEQIGFIMDEIKPLLRRQNYDRALELAVNHIRDVFNGKVLKKSFSFVSVIVGLLFVGIIFTTVFVAFKRQNKYKMCKAKLERIEEERNRAKNSKSYESQSCPICLETFSYADPPMKTRTLLCGHKYCEPCLVQWLETNATCPICRQTATPTNKDQDSASRSDSYDFYPELQFRLQSLNRMYPDFVTMEMISRWSSRQYRGSFASDSVFMHASPSLQTRASGSGGSFGGGGCHGGGGRGGSW